MSGALILGALFSPSNPARIPEVPHKVSICELKKDPSKYNHELVEVTGFVTHGFEDFGLFDPSCSSWPDIWIEYGGTKASDTMYCCGVTPGQERPRNVSVENIQIPLVKDDLFKKFEDIIAKEYDSILHVTLVGRFFAGKQVKYPGGTFWSGYGHMGCCSLLVIERVHSVDLHDRIDLDYRASADQPNISKSGCGYRDLTPITPYDQMLQFQKEAETGSPPWAFDDPARVALSELARLLKVPEATISNVQLKRKAPSRIIYEWPSPKEKATYMMVVSRPYLLSFFAHDVQKVPWVLIAAYRSSCGGDNSVTRVK